MSSPINLSNRESISTVPEELGVEYLVPLAERVPLPKPLFLLGGTSSNTPVTKDFCRSVSRLRGRSNLITRASALSSKPQIRKRRKDGDLGVPEAPAATSAQTEFSGALSQVSKTRRRRKDGDPGVPKAPVDNSAQDNEEIIEINTSDLHTQERNLDSITLECNSVENIPDELFSIFTFAFQTFLKEGRSHKATAFTIIKTIPNIFSKLHKYNLYSKKAYDNSLIELTKLYFSNPDIYSGFENMSEQISGIIGAIYYVPMMYFISSQESINLKNLQLKNASNIIKDKEIRRVVKNYLSSCNNEHNFDIFKHRINEICSIEKRSNPRGVFSLIKNKLNEFNNIQDLFNFAKKYS